MSIPIHTLESYGANEQAAIAQARVDAEHWLYAQRGTVQFGKQISCETLKSVYAYPAQRWLCTLKLEILRADPAALVQPNPVSHAA